MLPKLTSAKLALHKLGVETHVFAGSMASASGLRKLKRCTSVHLRAALEDLLGTVKLFSLPTWSRHGLMKMSVIIEELYGIRISSFDRPDQSVPGDHRSGLDVQPGHRATHVT